LECQLRRLKDYRVDRKRGRIVNGRAPEDSVIAPAGERATETSGIADDDVEFLEAEEE